MHISALLEHCTLEPLYSLGPDPMSVWFTNVYVLDKGISKFTLDLEKLNINNHFLSNISPIKKNKTKQHLLMRARHYEPRDNIGLWLCDSLIL